MLSLISGEEFIDRPQPPVMICLQPQRIIYPRAHAFCLPLGDGFLSHRHQIGIHRRRQSLLAAHISMLYSCHERRNRFDDPSTQPVIARLSHIWSVHVSAFGADGSLAGRTWCGRGHAAGAGRRPAICPGGGRSGQGRDARPAVRGRGRRRPTTPAGRRVLAGSHAPGSTRSRPT